MTCTLVIAPAVVPLLYQSLNARVWAPTDRVISMSMWPLFTVWSRLSSAAPRALTIVSPTGHRIEGATVEQALLLLKQLGG